MQKHLDGIGILFLGGLKNLMFLIENQKEA